MENKEEKRKQGHHRIRLDIIAIMAIFFVFLVISIFVSRGLSLFINIAALSLMLIFLLLGMKSLRTKNGAHQLQNCTDDLKEISKWLVECDREHPGDAWNRFKEQEEWEYTCNPLERAIKEAQREEDALGSDEEDGYRCDIANYVNEDLLSTAGNLPFNDFVSNVMTGLGILGTFVGLTIGLQSFDAETTEAMTNSIVPLINGIKIAFYTSIYGVAFSLIYGTIYRFHIKHAQEALDEFLDTYYRCNGRRPENDVVSRLLSYEQEQTMSMRQFAEDISLAVSDAVGNVLNPTLSTLPDQIAQSMQENLTPTLEKMETSFSELSKDLTDQLSAAQTEGVGTLVDQFVSEMNRLMDGQIQNLGQAIETICTWQKETIQHLDTAVEGICQNADNLAQINNGLSESIEKMENYIEKVTQLQQKSEEISNRTAEKLTSAAESVEITGNELAEITERSGEIMKEVYQITDSISKQEEALLQAAKEQVDNLQKCGNALESQMLNVDQVCGTAVNEFNEASEKMTATVENLNHQWTEVLSKSFSQFDSELAKALQHFSGTLSDLRDIVEGTPGVVDEALAAVAQLQTDSAKYLQKLVQYQTEFGASVEKAIGKVGNRMQQLEGKTEHNGNK